MPVHYTPNATVALSISPNLPKGCRAYLNGLEIPVGLDHDSWRKLGFQLARVAGATMWWLGDWLAYGLDNYVEGKSKKRVPKGLYKKLAEQLGCSEKKLSNAKWICSKLPISGRPPGLAMSHAQEIVSLATEDQFPFWVSRVTTEELTVAKLREELRSARAIYLPEHNDQGAYSFLEVARQFRRDYLADCEEWKPAYRAEVLKILGPVLGDLGISSSGM